MSYNINFYITVISLCFSLLSLNCTQNINLTQSYNNLEKFDNNNLHKKNNSSLNKDYNYEQLDSPQIVNVHHTKKNKPNLITSAKSVLLMDSKYNILYQKNTNIRLPCASLQKLLLAIIILENGNLDKKVLIQKIDTKTSPTVIGISPGESYSRKNLLKALLIKSSNDIARALARDHSGNINNFVNRMNTRARDIGMHDSNFVNATGLSNIPGQYSTVKDLMLLTLRALSFQFIRDAVKTKRMIFKFPNGKYKTIMNTNETLFYYPNCNGIKTGYTKLAGRCLISSAIKGEKYVISIILGSKLPDIWNESKRLLIYGLKNAE